MKIISVLIIAATMVGCKSLHENLQKPFVAYSGVVPLSETSVIIVRDESAQVQSDPRITGVNGKKLDCSLLFCPFWVRVNPGSHTFNAHYRVNHYWGSTSSGYQYADIEIKVPEMKPGHAYVARYKVYKDKLDADKLAISIEDLGYKPKYSVKLGLSGLNQDIYKLEF